MLLSSTLNGSAGNLKRGKNMKKLGKIVSIMLVGALTVSALSLAANAKGNESDDPTGFGVKDMSYAMAKIAVPMMNKVFDVANLLAGAAEVWTCLLYTSPSPRD